jgi:hypothetical protein
MKPYGDYAQLLKSSCLAGTDGEKTFNAVFGDEARLVVVLYRDGWGQTPWTRIEETAIRNRAYDHGYDFVKFIPLDDKPAVPKWLPRTQLWLGIKRWGAEGAASVIEARVEELGGEAKEESALDRATRFERSRKFIEQRQQFLNSDAGVNAANTEFENLTSSVERLIAEIKESASVPLQMKKAGNQFLVLGLRIGLSVEWLNRFRNTLDQSKLCISLWNAHPLFPGIRHFNEPKQLGEETFKFDLLPSAQTCWSYDGYVERSLDTHSLADFILKYYIDEAESYNPEGGDDDDD